MIKTLTYVGLALVAILIFDQFMKRDAETLCSNDATAYDGCP